jgi:hypothetical protein
MAARRRDVKSMLQPGMGGAWDQRGNHLNQCRPEIQEQDVCKTKCIKPSSSKASGFAGD